MRLFAILLLMLASAPAFAETPGIVGQLEQSSTTSPKEKTDFAASAVDEMKAGVAQVEKLLEDATKEANQEHIDCLTRKLVPMRALVEVGATSSASMISYIASSDTVHADQEYRKIAVALSKSKEFLSEALACVADAAASRGDSTVAMIDGGISLATTDLIDQDVIPESDVPDWSSPN